MGFPRKMRMKVSPNSQTLSCGVTLHAIRGFEFKVQWFWFKHGKELHRSNLDDLVQEVNSLKSACSAA
jgi:hypothetical protein